MKVVVSGTETDSSATQTPKADLSRSETESKSSSIVMRALSKTSDKLSRRVSGDGRSLSQSQTTTPTRGSRHLFSLHRSKGNLRDATTEAAGSAGMRT